MSRHTRGAAKKFWVFLLMGLTVLPGCAPTQPFYMFEKGDLQRYIDTATEIEYPDVDRAAFAEAAGAKEPLTIINPHFDEFWDLPLEEAICIALKNSKVMRTFGIGTVRVGQGTASIVPDRLLTAVDALPTVYDPALAETNPGSIGRGVGISNTNSNFSHGAAAPGGLATGGEQGVEAALAAFDARLEVASNYANTDRPQNFDPTAVPGNVFPSLSQQDRWNNYIQFSKRAATGTEFYARTNANWTKSNQGNRVVPNDWLANLEIEARQPILRGAGTQVNRMNVMVARINTDTSLADFEIGVRNLVSDVEWAFWDLYHQFRTLETRKIARDSALISWKRVKAKEIAGAVGGEAEKEAQARQQYFRFRSEVENALHTVFQTENRLRYIMGLTATDGRMIRPADEPVTAAVQFDWRQILCEALYRSPELRKQKWRIKRRELEMITARNGLLPTLDAVALYRWVGLGDHLIRAGRRGNNFAENFPGAPAPAPDGSVAWDELTEGEFQEYAVGLRFEMPLGFRRELAAVRWAQLAQAREKARLDEMELELTHALTNAYQDVEAFYQSLQTNYNWRVAAQKEVDAVQAAFDVGTATLDLLLRAQQSRADAEVAYYDSLKEYNLAIARVHWRKGSLLEYNSVCLAEGPWPGKAYFDAMGHARRRDASHYLDYGYTRPSVMSRGEYPQFQNQGGEPGTFETEGLETAPLPYEEVPPGDETLEVPLPPDPDAMFEEVVPLRQPVDTATRPEGPVLAPPVLRPVSGSIDEAAPIGSGVKPTGDQAYNWGVVGSQLDAAPSRATQLRVPVIVASHESPVQPAAGPVSAPTAAEKAATLELAQPDSVSDSGWQQR